MWSRLFTLPCVLALAAALTGCAATRATDETQAVAGLPAVTRLEKAGGRVAVAEAGGGKLILTDGGVVRVSAGRAKLESRIPSGFSLEPATVVERLAVLPGGTRGGGCDRVGVWEFATPSSTPTPIVPGDQVAGVMAVDLLGDSTPELVLIANRVWRNTGSPQDYHERVEVWSLEDDRPARLYRADIVPAGRVSLIDRVYAIDTGLGDERPELLWGQVDASSNVDGDSRLVLVDPSRGFTARMSSRFERWFGIAGARQAAGQTRLLLETTFVEPRRTMVMDVREDGFHGAEDKADAEDFELPLHTVSSESYRREPPIPADRRVGVKVRHLRSDQSAPVEVTFADGHRQLLEPSKPVLVIKDLGLADLDGDREDELVVTGAGEPGVCSDTRTGYVGWAERGPDGRFGKVRWSQPLGGGIAGLAISDVDGQPGDEVIVGIVDSYCSGIPSGLWIFSYHAESP